MANRARTGKKYELSKVQAREWCQMQFEVVGHGIAEIARKSGFSEATLWKWKKIHGWKEKGSSVGKIEELTRQKFLGLLAQKGLPPEKVAEIIADGVQSPMKDQIIAPDESGKGAKVLFEGVPDHSAREKYLRNYLAIAGMVGGSGKDINVNNNGEGSVNIQVNLPTKD